LGSDWREKKYQEASSCPNFSIFLSISYQRPQGLKMEPAGNKVVSRVLRAKRQNILALPSELLLYVTLKENDIFPSFFSKKKRAVLFMRGSSLFCVTEGREEGSPSWPRGATCELWRFLERSGLTRFKVLGEKDLCFCCYPKDFFAFILWV
jgi:hypothetical protein